jgi:hypothetical protein
MDKKTLKTELLKAAEGTEGRSQAAQLRDIIDEVEAAIAAGVKRAVILERLAKAGLMMTATNFDSALRRIRQERKGTKPEPPNQERRQEAGAMEQHDEALDAPVTPADQESAALRETLALGEKYRKERREAAKQERLNRKK